MLPLQYKVSLESYLLYANWMERAPWKKIKEFGSENEGEF